MQQSSTGEMDCGISIEVAAALNQSPIIEGFSGKADVAQNWDSHALDQAVDRFRFDLGKQSNTSGSPATSHSNSNGEQPSVGQYNFQVVPQAEGVVANSARR